jgi:hypothetical protein
VVKLADSGVERLPAASKARIRTECAVPAGRPETTTDRAALAITL